MKTALVLDNVCCGLFDEPDNSAPDYLNDPRYKVVDSQYADDIRIGWVLDGSVWSAPTPPLQQYKRDGINRTEWRERVLTISEQVRIDKAMALLDVDMSWLVSGVVALGAKVDTSTYPELAPLAGFTYRDALRSTFKAYNDAQLLSVNNLALRMGVLLLAITGLLDAPERKDTVLLGVPE